AERFEHARRGDLALAAHDAVERAAGVLEQLPGDERGAVATGEDEGLRPPAARGHGQVEHLGDVGQVVQREPHCARLEGVQLTDVVLVAEDLEVEEAHLVAGGAQRLGHALEPERLQLQIHFRVHERTRMDEQNAHGHLVPMVGGLGPVRGPMGLLQRLQCDVDDHPTDTGRHETQPSRAHRFVSPGASAALARSGVSGTRRMRTPVASKKALAMAAGTVRVDGSPAPEAGIVGWSWSTMSIRSRAYWLSAYG